MADTFPCPYCGATYPVKPVLIGRPVRCTTCRNVFKLREDGLADRVDPPAEPAASSGTSQQTEDAAAEAAKKQAAEQAAKQAERKKAAAAKAAAARAQLAAAQAQAEAASASAAASVPAVDLDESEDEDDAFAAADREAEAADAQQRAAKAKEQRQAGNKVSGRHSTRLTARQETMRRTMAATLTDAAKAALDSEQVKREAERQASQDKKERIKTGDAEIGPAVLTGYGESEARNSRQWAIGCLIVGLLVGIGMLMSWSKTDQEAVLSAFVEPVDGPDWRSPQQRVQLVRSRAWLFDPGMPFIVNLDEATISKEEVVSLEGLDELLQDTVAGKVLLADRGLWIAVGQLSDARQVLGELDYAADRKTVSKALVKAEVKHDWHEDFIKAVNAWDADDKARQLVLMLMNGRTDYTDTNWIRDLMTVGAAYVQRDRKDEVKPIIPQRLHLWYFGAEDGRRLSNRQGNRAQTKTDQLYRGRILRIEGQQWRGLEVKGKRIEAMHVLDVQVASSKDRSFLPGVPGYGDALSDSADDSDADTGADLETANNDDGEDSDQDDG